MSQKRNTWRGRHMSPTISLDTGQDKHGSEKDRTSKKKETHSCEHKVVPSLKQGPHSIGSVPLHQSKPIYYLGLQAIFVIFCLLLANYLRKFMSPFIRGFFLNDTSIQYPYKSSTYPYLPMLAICNISLLLMIMITEVMCYSKFGRLAWRHNYDFFVISNYMLHPMAAKILQFSLLCLFGHATNTIVITILKYSFGQLRPNFMDVCKPITDRAGNYVESYKCNSTIYGEELVLDSHLSFPSGHSGTSFYYAAFAIVGDLFIYVQYRLSRYLPSWRVALLLFQWLLFTFAVMIGLSRITDNKHHASDVICGALLGTGTALSVLFTHKHLLINVPRNPPADSNSVTKEVCMSELEEALPARKRHDACSV